MKKSCVIDASVAAKWLLTDEPNPQAEILKDDFRNKDISICVPIFLFYEVNNLLKSATLSKRISTKNAHDLYQEFLDLDFTIYHSRQLLELTLQKALDLDISSYDASYIALAEYLEIPFYTADEKLVKKAKNKLVKSLADYS